MEAVELKVPPVGESIAEVTIAEWLKKEGDAVERDEAVVELETEKATVELPAPASGVLRRILKAKGQKAAIGETIGLLEPRVPATAAPGPVRAEVVPATPAQAVRVMPAAAVALAERGLRPEEVRATGPGGRLLKEDVLDPPHAELTTQPAVVEPPSGPPPSGAREDHVVPMTPIRRTIAARLVQAKQEMAMLTTFNEVDMGDMMALRKEYQEEFQQRHGVRLGMMSFFVKAVINALGEFPQLNAELRGDNIVYHRHFDIGIAVGSGKGLAVPVIRDAERLSFAELERTVGDFGRRAKENKLRLEELRGGTFTISNGGVYGSLLSTPIINPPQTGILGLHAIQDRPVARGGQVVIRPMMYVALSYDHRIIDGREAVTFLRRIKEQVEKPSRLLLGV
ncbi:MAG: 2-oxoglutarate dehydrogenase complex dihydrolipoyllysine-residue succinyltransferase [Deltaproteobacteria bacterium]|nr:2-oxoglutarate dehydrogenase complex dihydrolipoyllysine-residue succinyltransferase [Deltaproteobacteria bacterium]